MILVDATPLQSDHRDRGIGTYVHNLSVGLTRDAGDRVRFLLARGGLRARELPVAGRTVSFRRVHRPAQCYWLYNEWFLRRALWALRPEVFHATDFNGFVKTRKSRTVATLYDLTPLTSTQSSPTLSSVTAGLRSFVYYRAKLPLADHVIAISEVVRREAIHLLDIDPDRITTVPLGVDLRRFSPAKTNDAFARRGPYLLFLGNDAPHKNLDRVLQAFARITATYCSPIALYIAGPWARDSLERLRALSSGLGVAGRIECLGHVPTADLPSLYGNAVALVCPSLKEGFGLPLLEAMACGTPVLSSIGGAQAETAGNAALLVDPLRLDELISALRSLLDSPALREHLRARGLARAARFPWADTVRRTLEVYDRMLDSAHTRK